ncbi:MAG: hypothetical protein ACXVA9_05235 [Bdellovibrionales bacterium]
MSSTNERPGSTRDAKPIELDRWEGEGGNPPRARGKRQDPSPTIAGILRKLLVDWHFINSPSAKN